MTLQIKICGLSSEATISAAIEAGADMVGLVFFPRSPRNVSLQIARQLARHARGRSSIVALLVDPDDALIDAIVGEISPDILQLHGTEDPERVAAIRARFGVPVMKALRIADANDLAPVAGFSAHVDRFLLDAKAPANLAGTLPGGNGISFDWRLVAGLDPGRPWMLSGGLDCANVADAIRLTGAPGVDVSSGVERRPGEKDVGLIKAFVAAARAAL